jgi:DNA-directed RNA polymerase subunit RPC12/RpoP
MSGHIEKQCPNCGQQLRIPKNVGGILMACPSCGHKFSSDFKFGGVGKQKGVLMRIFEFPQAMLKRISRFF